MTALKAIESKDTLTVLTEVFAASNDAVVILDEEGAFLYANKAFIELTGYPEDEFFELTITDIDPIDKEAWQQRFQVMVEQKSLTAEIELRRKDGSVMPIEVTANATKLDGKFIAVGVARDTQKRHDAIKALGEREKRLASIFAAAPVGIGLVVNRKITKVNERLCEMMCCEPDYMLGKNARFLYPSQEEYEWVGKEKYAQIAVKGTGTVETKWVRKDGQIIDVILSSTPLDPNDLEVGVTFTALDISARNELERQLRHSQKMESVGRLAGGIAHDFNNILQAVIGYSELIKLDPASPESVAENIAESLKASVRAKALVNQLLTFSRHDLPAREPLELNLVVEDMAKMLAHLLGEQVELSVSCQKPVGIVLADKSQIQQILVNLCVNGRDAMPSGGRLEIEVDEKAIGDEGCPGCTGGLPGTYVTLSVRDHGVGMSDEIKDRIFEPFFTTKGVGQGTGLGLATVYAIVDRMGGFICVNSRVDVGTDVHVHLPISDETFNEATSAKSQEPQKGEKELILVAEDEVLIRDLTVRILKESNYEVIVANNGLEAQKLFSERQDEVKLCILDAIMPKCNGADAADAITKMKPGTPIIFCSGYSYETLRSSNIAVAASKILKKPFNRIELLAYVRNAIDGAA